MTAGGAEWEQGRAVTRMVTALQAGDHDAMALAMADYAAALGTRTTAILSAIVAPILIELQAVRLERETGGRSIEHKLDLILLSHETIVNRLTAIEESTLSRTIDGVTRQQLIDLAHTIPDLTARIERLEADRDRTE